MKRYLVAAFVMAILCGVFASGASADVLLFDRGLPTANLNNAAGANRSNVAWGDTPSTMYLPGDNFTLSGSGSYNVTTITVWAVQPTNTGSLSLWLGPQGGTISNIGAPASVTSVTYSDGTTYQGSSGSFLNLYQVNFTINQVLNAGTYDFFLGGTSSDGNTAYLHASNAALSGSPQQGADDTFLWLNSATGQVLTWYSGTGGGTSAFGPGWDKNSDANVQVYGSAVPLPAALWLRGPGLAGLAAIRRRFKA